MEYIYSQESARVLVVDDEKVIRDILADFLTSEGYRVSSAENGAKALEELRQNHYNLMITDLKMPELGGIELLEKIKQENINVITVIMTGFATVETAIRAMKHGAYDYILKPFKVDEVVQIIRRALDKQRLEQENIQLKETMALYKVSEAMSTSLDLDNILQIVMDTTKVEMEADAVSLILEEPQDDESSMTTTMTLVMGDTESVDGLYGTLDHALLIEYLGSNPYLIVHGSKAKRFFINPPHDQYLGSFLSVPLKVRDQVLGVVNAYSYKRNFKFTEGRAKVFVILASRASQAIENARLYENLQRTFRETIQGLVSTLEAKDKYTSGHSRRVTEYATLVARALNLPDDLVEKIDRAGLLHDIGKIGIRLEALNKPEKISQAEHEMFKDHTIMGKQILESIHFLREIVPMVLYHHEWFDGSGYPEGKRGHDIPLGARILAVADSYDAMTSDRPYRKAMSQEQGVKELKRCSGTQFDPDIVELFIEELGKNQEMVDKIAADWMGVESKPA